MAMAPEVPIRAGSGYLISFIDLDAISDDLPLTAGSPAETSLGVSWIKGTSAWASATAESPSEVAIPIGIPNQATPPQRNAFTLVRGSEAMARCQYAWSLNTVPKLPTILRTTFLKQGSSEKYKTDHQR